jgi:hypothetical protein
VNAADVQLAFVIVNPFATGCFIAVHVTLLVDLVGVDKISRAFSMVMFYQGACVRARTICTVRRRHHTVHGAVADWRAL